MQEFLEYYLPAKFRELVDLSEITVEKESFVADDLKMMLSDIVYNKN
ncbi:MAG: Rpn family recombination-promoting nuclease/putative transposase [Candidatus Midichloria sp.]|nr:Rpn family recombination-promoting nuclease/putative transposase [Candidatus Midichloria sp.]